MKQSELIIGKSYTDNKGEVRTIINREGDSIYYVYGQLSPYPKQLICFCHQWVFARWAKFETPCPESGKVRLS